MGTFECEICGEENRDYPQSKVSHHTSYAPERSITICKACHTKLHRREGWRDDLLPDISRAEAEERNLLAASAPAHRADGDGETMVTTIRLPERLVEDLDEEWEEYGLENRTEYIHWILRHRHEIESEIRGGSPPDENTRTEYARIQDVENLRKEVEELKTILADTVGKDGQETGSRSVESIEATTEQTKEGDEQISSLVEELEIPGRGYDTRQERAEVAAEYLAWVRDRGEVARSDVIHEFVSENLLERAGYSSGESYWEKMGRDLLQGAADHGVVEIEGRAYRWVGGE